jgi:hypothetical protein
MPSSPLTPDQNRPGKASTPLKLPWPTGQVQQDYGHGMELSFDQSIEFALGKPGQL